MSRSTSKVRAEKSHATPALVLPPSSSPALHVDTGSTNNFAGCLSKFEWMDLVEQEEGEEVVAEILDELMCCVMEKCFQSHLQRQLVPFTVSWIRLSLLRTLELQFLERDEGEAQDSSPLWEEDSEPQPCAIDSWAQGCVPVVYSKPRSKNISRQRSVELFEASSSPGSPQARHLKVNEESNSDRDSCEDDQNQNNCQRDAGFRGGVLIPCPPAKREPKKINPQPHCTAPRVGNTSCLTRRPISLSLCKEEHLITKDQTIHVYKSKRAQKLPDLTTTKRLDPARLVQHHVWPGFEVLESTVPHIPIRKSSVPPMLRQKHDKYNAAFKFPASSQGSDKIRLRRSADAALCVSSKYANFQDNGKPQTSMLLPSDLLLNTMVLSPGVTLKDPHRVQSNYSNSVLAQTGHRQNLAPIRSSLPAPL
ncbi:hypothetical protein GJAV_G00044870 [Gymnothorax javanicus]|nr:hypothetical protein GJAV_G00044870 [Gymnothorax javanicus]